MYKTLAPGAIGVKFESLLAAITAARQHGYAGLEFSVNRAADLIDRQGPTAVEYFFISREVKPAVFGLPVNWRGPQEDFEKSMVELPRLAKAAQSVGCTRTATWIMPCSDELPLNENKRFHIDRLKPAAAILADHGISFGMEFIGPRTLRESKKHPFIYKMEDMLDLAGEIGPNVGLLLDSFHWYTSHGTAEDLRKLRPEQIVYVHVNDAQAGLDPDQQIDNIRDLPAATGVIDIQTFMQVLADIHYPGPVAVEPFKKELADLPNDSLRLDAVSASLDNIFPPG